MRSLLLEGTKLLGGKEVAEEKDVGIHYRNSPCGWEEEEEEGAKSQGTM